MLNELQKKAVHTTEGRLLILAGAGSGKTGVIIHRIAHLIQEKQIPPDNILGLTFTNKAAKEMKHRLEALIGLKQTKPMTLTTFHSFCMQILRKEIDKLGYTTGFSLYDEKDIERVICQIAKEMLGMEQEIPSLAPTKMALMKAHYQDKEKTTWHDQFTSDLHERLQSALRAYNAVSFDHLISLTVLLFEQFPAVLDQYQERYRYIMVDECQDMNPPQLKLTELIAKKYHNLCVVGDDDQSIYGWRGAEVNYILKFKADHTIKLEQNYRSTKTILKAANAVIAHNQNRHTKNLWTSKETSSLIEIFNAPTDIEEADAVIARILNWKIKHNFAFKDMAILYRSNALSRTFELALMQASWKQGEHWVRGIPYEIFGGLEFSERREIKDILAYLRVIANPKDEEALLRIINVPRRGISDPFLDLLTKQNRQAKIPLWTLIQSVSANHDQFSSHPKGKAGLTSLIDIIQKYQTQFASNTPLAETLTSFIEEIQYKKAIEAEVKSDTMRQFKWENVQECVNALAQYQEEMKKEASLQDFVATTALAPHHFADSSSKSKEDKVQLMTLHSAKGLEFPICFIVGLEDHILPHEKSMQETGIEEERRLFYVGITRAKQQLTLSMARSRMKMGKHQPTTPSRFLFEIPNHLLNPTSPKIV